jgi:glycosyltransferase involved in cell wall biosynthesis
MMVSVIIPAKNEERYLPRLLESIRRQDVAVTEIIVADGDSTDATIAIARRNGCVVCSGVGHPSIGRNNGARLATGDLLLFVDADTILPDRFLARFLSGMQKRGLRCAIPAYMPYDGSPLLSILFGLSNAAMYLTRRWVQYGAGYFIAIHRDEFDALGGFDERLYLGEDHDLVTRASRLAKYDMLAIRVLISTRRYRTSGARVTLRLYAKATLAHLRGARITEPLAEYPFGVHDSTPVDRK